MVHAIVTGEFLGLAVTGLQEDAPAIVLALALHNLLSAVGVL